ncbi:hypothetical protein MINT15_35760 [Saccharomonospora viridis]|uniref:Uncharacterized protein n=1 Tax=Saccharomonospora viridis TaxID=1852 RepID=A0A837DAF3_9PSEU|nr:hypothetical protein MINT15_35760 [Saccharomonospora viridis]
MAGRKIGEWGRAFGGHHVRACSARDDVRLTFLASSAEGVPYGR